MGTRVPWLCPGTTFFQQINLHEKKFFFFAYIANQIASKKIKPRGIGSSDKKKFHKVIDKNVRWWAPGYPVVHIRVKKPLASLKAKIPFERKTPGTSHDIL